MNDLRAYGEYPSDIPRTGRKKSFIPANHLAGASSPCLRERANDPVGWLEWSDEAFTYARTYDRPLFVSIGYLSSHWCRIMNNDCFSDPEVASLLNASCIPVYVDAEERPDIDAIMTEICILQSGSTGKPLNVFLLPDGRPFFCATWLPKRTTGSVPGITELLPRVRWLWHMQRDDVERSADSLSVMLNARLAELEGGKSGKLSKSKSYEAMSSIRKIFDMRWGGWGGVPKLPEPSKMLFLAHEAVKADSPRDKSDAETMLDVTLRRIWRGGIHDQIGGGIMHCAVDERWIVPHFEKMLCEQALILFAVSLAEERSQNAFHRMFAEDIIFCALKYFADDNAFSQAFRSSIDGDTDSGEGRYYTWSEDEVRRILPEGEAGLFSLAYGMLPGGNLKAEIAGTQMGQNVLYEASTVSELAKRNGLKPDEVVQRLNECRKILLDARDKRYPLKYDGKILMGWNGLMIAALSRASTAFNQSEWKDLAERCALFINKNMSDKGGEWRRVWLDGKTYIPAQAEDYAYLLWGIIELYKASKHFNAGEKQLDDWLKSAQALADAMIAKLWDEKHGGLFQTDGTDRYLFARMKSAIDANMRPSANAIAAIALTQLGIMLEDKKYTDYAKEIISCFAHCVNDDTMACLSMLTANALWVPVKKKPAPPPKPVPTDEELNREVPTPEVTVQEAPRRPARRTARPEHTDRTERRRANRRRER